MTRTRASAKAAGAAAERAVADYLAQALDERWLPIPGWEGQYEVSDQGSVRSLDRYITFPYGRRRAAGCVLSPGVRPDGHLNVSLCGKSKLVHQLVMLAFVGERPDGFEVCHNNGDPADNRLENLRYGTASDNGRDRVRHGTHNMANKTHCPQGHPYDEDNTLIHKGRRNCKACRNAYAREYRRKKAAA